MNLPDLTPENCEATLERLANGEVCETCSGGRVYLKIEGKEYTCNKCDGVGHTSPDLRMIDALVCLELGYEVVHGKWNTDTMPETLEFQIDGRLQGDVPHYTTDWGAVGELLEELIKKGMTILELRDDMEKYKGLFNCCMSENNGSAIGYNAKKITTAIACAWLEMRIKENESNT